MGGLYRRQDRELHGKVTGRLSEHGDMWTRIGEKSSPETGCATIESAENTPQPRQAGDGEQMRSFSTTLQDARVRLALLAALFGSYFGSLWLGSLHFPHAYDWRRNVISNLLSPRDNPQWYWLPSVGVAIAGLCMLQLGVWIEREMGDSGSKLARCVRRPAFLIGIGCLILSALIVPQHIHPVLGTRHLHEILARTSAAGLGVGMICACMSAVQAGDEERLRRLRTVRTIWRALTVPPILGAVGSGLIVGLARWHGMGTGAADFFRGTVFWHLAFWEWVGSVAVFLFFASPVMILGSRARETAA